MTPHYDLKQQEKKNNGVSGSWLGGGGHKHFCHISWGGVEYFFPTGLAGSSKVLPTIWKRNRPHPPPNNK